MVVGLVAVILSHFHDGLRLHFVLEATVLERVVVILVVASA